MPKVTFLVGIPCSGKSTWARTQPISVLSRDIIREEIFGKDYKQNYKNEIYVTEIFNNRLKTHIRKNHDFIIDNTNVIKKYINEIVKQLPDYYIYEFKLFPINLFTAYYRNIIRYLNTGKFISFIVINKMQKSYKNLTI